MTEDPPRLKSHGDTPEELRAALRAMRDEYTDAARLSRVEQQLETRIEGARSGSALSEALKRAVQQSLTTKLMVAGLVLGTGAMWLTQTTSKPLGNAPEASPASPALKGAADAPLVQTSAVSDEETGRLPAPTTQSAPRETVPSLRNGDGTSYVEPRGEPASHSARIPKRHPSPASTERTRSKLGSDRGTRPVTLATDSPADESAPTLGHDQGAAPAERAHEPSPVQRSEVDLLLEARRLARRDPQAALVLLDEHQRRFEAGVLAPEREVLAIEVLRELGQTQAAEERLRGFRKRYPESVHKRRLDRH